MEPGPTLALISDVVPHDELERLAAALNTQITRDLVPAWGVSSLVVAVGREDPPAGAWPVRIQAELEFETFAYHVVEDGVPAIYVLHNPDWWRYAVSHEVLEALVTPDNLRFLTAPAPDTGEPVEVLVQVCDPCGMDAGYEVDGLRLADFVLPAYYERAGRPPFDHAGLVEKPLRLLEGGYLTWRTPSGEMLQGRMVGGSLQVRPLTGPAEPQDAAEDEAEREPARTGGLAGAGNDAVGERDQLGFEHYVQCFADLIASPQTSPPLTIGIYGSWGVGKSFLLRNIERRLGARPRAPDAPVIHVVQFNAWEYSAADTVWPALVRKIMVCLEEKTHWPFPGRFLRKLWRNLLWELRQERAHLLGALAGAALLLALLLTVNGLKVAPLWAAAVALGAGGVIKVVGDTLTNPVSRWMAKLLEDGGYGSAAGAMGRIRDDLEWLEKQLAKEKGRFVVMIDDLDRCEPDKAVEVLQAINLLLNFDSFIVCLGIDARIVTRAVERHYRGLLGPAGASGYEYLDKIVQIPFRIPRPTDQDIVTFLGEQMPYEAEPEIAAPPPVPAAAPPPEGERPAAGPGPIGAPIPDAPQELTAWGPDEREAFQRLAAWLRPNPRHLKRLVNVYRLVRGLAILRGERAILDDPLSTIKVLVLCAQWPYAAAAMLDRLDERIEIEEDWPPGDPLQVLYGEVEAGLDPEARARLDDDPDDLAGLLHAAAGRLDGEALARVRAYTVNFNPAVESELRRARAVVEASGNGAGDQAGRSRTAVP
jgi:hypothetical protein